MNEKSRPEGRPSENSAAAAKKLLILDAHSTATTDSSAPGDAA